MPDFFIRIASFAERANPGGEANKVKTFTKDAAATTQLYAQSSDGTVHTITPVSTFSGAGTEFTWGTSSGTGVDTANDTRYMPLGYSTLAASLTATWDFLLPRSGTLSALYAYYAVNGTGANSITYTVMLNGVATALAFTATNTAPAANLVNTVACAKGDRLSLRVTKSGVLTTSPTGISISCRYQ